MSLTKLGTVRRTPSSIGRAQTRGHAQWQPVLRRDNPASACKPIPELEIVSEPPSLHVLPTKSLRSTWDELVQRGTEVVAGEHDHPRPVPRRHDTKPPCFEIKR